MIRSQAVVGHSLVHCCDLRSFGWYLGGEGTVPRAEQRPPWAFRCLFVPPATSGLKWTTSWSPGTYGLPAFRKEGWIPSIGLSSRAPSLLRRERNGGQGGVGAMCL